MNRNKPKRMMETSKEKKKSPVLKLLLVVILIGMVVLFIKKVPITELLSKQFSNNIKNESKNDTSLIIYYSFDDGLKKPLDNNNTWGNVTKISWMEDCLGIIKKDGKDFSKENNTVLIKDGVYEITVSSADGKNKTTKTLTIDRTPPKVEIKKNESGSFTITFEDVNDVRSAILRKIDTKTQKIANEIDLKANGLKKSIEVTEQGYYILEVVDEYGNWLEENREFIIR